MCLGLTWHDVVHMYECHKLASARNYLKSRSEVVRLISCFPKSNKGMKDDYLIVSGEWNDGFHCPTRAGELGGVLLELVPLAGDFSTLNFLAKFFFFSLFFLHPTLTFRLLE